MRFFFLVILLTGLALGVGYPLAVQNVSGYQIGAVSLFDEEGFKSAEIPMSPTEAPVRVRIALQVPERIVPVAGKPLFELAVSVGDRLVLKQHVTFEGAVAKATLQGSGFVYEEETAEIDPVVGGDPYRFTLTPVAGSTLLPDRVDLILNAGAFGLDPRAVPVGYGMIAVGLVGFLAMARRRRRLNRRDEPAPTSRSEPGEE